MVRHTRKKKTTSSKRKEGVYVGGRGANKCVFINFINHEGLGNQLFIYATGLLVAKKTGLHLCIMSEKTNPHSKTDYRLLLNGQIVEKANVKSRVNSAKTLLPHIHSLIGKWTNANIHYNSSKNTNAKLPDYLYQSYSSVQRAIPEVKQTLLKNEFHKGNYQQIKTDHAIDPTKSAFMHVRRGDYVDRDWVVLIDYYENGLELFDTVPEIEIIYVVSNDLKWCKDHDSKWKGATKKPIKYLDDMNELETLYVMMLCEAGALISNSTFSAWGAMMGADMNPHSTIIYPSPWLQTNGKDPNPLAFPERWKQVENTSIK